jgi:hypothetical protein
MAGEGDAGRGIEMEGGALSGADLCQLCLAVTCLDIGLCHGHHRHQRCTRLDVIADTQGPLADHTVHRR